MLGPLVRASLFRPHTKREKWRLTACLAPLRACDWLRVVARGSHVRNRRLHYPLRASRLCQPTHFGAVVVIGSVCRRDPGSSIGPFPILRLGFFLPTFCSSLAQFPYWIGVFLFVSRTKCEFNEFCLGTQSPFDTPSFPCVCHHETFWHNILYRYPNNERYR